eukprot:30006-Heterocapsa_arctica.AAC.1
MNDSGPGGHRFFIQWPEAHLDSLFAGFSGRGLQQCVFRLGESGPRLIWTRDVQGSVAVCYKNVCVRLGESST